MEIITLKKMILDQNWAEGIAQYTAMDICWQNFDGYDWGVLAVSTVILFFISLIQEKNDGTTIRQLLDRKPFVLRLAVIVTGIMLIAVFGMYGPGFSAAEFVYMQF